MIYWDIYEITSETTLLHGVMLRGRIRKLGLENNFIILIENASDCENTVRFGVPWDFDISLVRDYIQKIVSDAVIQKVLLKIGNPVLSKLQVNKEERYTL